MKPMTRDQRLNQTPSSAVSLVAEKVSNDVMSEGTMPLTTCSRTSVSKNPPPSAMARAASARRVPVRYAGPEGETGEDEAENGPEQQTLHDRGDGCEMLHFGQPEATT